MSLHSRLPIEFTLEERVTAINSLCDKLSERGAQIERLRWRVAIELYAVRKIVSAEGLEWEPWCRANINRSLRDVRRLIKMAKGHDPEAAHEAAKASRRTSSRRPDTVSAVDPERSAEAARQLITAILVCHSISEARAMLDLVEMRDLIEALDDAEAGPPSARAVRVISTATH
jgi:hypothetical protein